MSDVHSSNLWANARSRLDNSAATPATQAAEASTPPPRPPPPPSAQKDARSTSRPTIPPTQAAPAAPVSSPLLTKAQQEGDVVSSDHSGSRRSFSARCRVRAKGVPAPATSSSPIPFELQMPSAAATSLHEAAYYKPVLRETGLRHEEMKTKAFAHTASVADFVSSPRVPIPPHVPAPVPASLSKEWRGTPPPGNPGGSGFQDQPVAPTVSPLTSSRTGESLAPPPVLDPARLVRTRSEKGNQPPRLCPTVPCKEVSAYGDDNVNLVADHVAGQAAQDSHPREQYEAASRSTISSGRLPVKHSSTNTVTGTRAPMQQCKQGRHSSQQSAGCVLSSKKKKKRPPGHVEKDGTPYWVKKLAKKIVKGRVKTTRPSELHPVVLEPSRSLESAEESEPMVQLKPATAPQSKTASSNRGTSGPSWAKISLRPTGHAVAVLLGQEIKSTIPHPMSEGEDGLTPIQQQKLQGATKQYQPAQTAEAPPPAQQEQPILVVTASSQFSSSRKLTSPSQSPPPSLTVPAWTSSNAVPKPSLLAPSQHASSTRSPSPSKANLPSGLLSPKHLQPTFRTSYLWQGSLRASSLSKANRGSLAPPPELSMSHPRRIPEPHRQKCSPSLIPPSLPPQSGEADAPIDKELLHVLPNPDAPMAFFLPWDQCDQQKEGTFFQPIRVAAHVGKQHLQQKRPHEVVTLPPPSEEQPQDQFRASSPVIQPESAPTPGGFMCPLPAAVGTPKRGSRSIPMPSPRPAHHRRRQRQQQQLQLSPLQGKRYLLPPIPAMSAPTWANQHSKPRSNKQSPSPQQPRKAKPSWVLEKPMLRCTAQGEATKSGHGIHFQAFIPEPLEDTIPKLQQLRLDRRAVWQAAQGEAQEEDALQHGRAMPMPPPLQPALDHKNSAHFLRPSVLSDQHITSHVPPASPDLPQRYSLRSIDERHSPTTSVNEEDNSVSSVSELTEAALLDDSQLALQMERRSSAATAPSWASGTVILKKTGKKTDLWPARATIESSVRAQKEQSQMPTVANISSRETSSSKISGPEEPAKSEEKEAEPPRQRHKPPEGATPELLPATRPVIVAPASPRHHTTSTTTTLTITSTTKKPDRGSTGVNQAGIQASVVAAMAAAAATGNTIPPWAGKLKPAEASEDVTRGVDMKPVSDEPHCRWRASRQRPAGGELPFDEGTLFHKVLTPPCLPQGRQPMMMPPAVKFGSPSWDPSHKEMATPRSRSSTVWPTPLSSQTSCVEEHPTLKAVRLVNTVWKESDLKPSTPSPLHRPTAACHVVVPPHENMVPERPHWAAGRPSPEATGNSIDASSGFETQPQSAFSPASTPGSTSLQLSLNRFKSLEDDRFSMPMPPDPVKSSLLHVALCPNCNSNAVKECKAVQVESKAKKPENNEFSAKLTADQKVPIQVSCHESDLPSDEEQDLFEACAQRSSANLSSPGMKPKEKPKSVVVTDVHSGVGFELVQRAASPMLDSFLSASPKKLGTNVKNLASGSQSAAESILSTRRLAVKGSGRLKQADEGLGKFVVMGDATLEPKLETTDSMLQIDGPMPVVIQQVASETKVGLSPHEKEAEEVAQDVDSIAFLPANCKKSIVLHSEESSPSQGENNVLADGVGFTAIGALAEKAKAGGIVATKEPKHFSSPCPHSDAAMGLKANEGEGSSVMGKMGSASPELEHLSPPSAPLTDLRACNATELSHCCSETASESSQEQHSKQKKILAPWVIHKMAPAWTARTYAQVTAVEPFMPESATMDLETEADVITDSTISKPDPVEDRCLNSASGDLQIGGQLHGEALLVSPPGDPILFGSSNEAALNSFEFNTVTNPVQQLPPFFSKPTFIFDHNGPTNEVTFHSSNQSSCQVGTKPNSELALPLSPKASENVLSPTESDRTENNEAATFEAVDDIGDAAMAASLDKQDASRSGLSSSPFNSPDKNWKSAEEGAAKTAVAVGADEGTYATAEMERERLMPRSARGGPLPQTSKVEVEISDESGEGLKNINEAEAMTLNRIFPGLPDETIDVVEQVTRAAIGAVDGFIEAVLLEPERSARNGDASAQSVKLVKEVNKEAGHAPGNVNEAAVMEIKKVDSLAPAPSSVNAEVVACEIIKMVTEAVGGIGDTAMMDANVQEFNNEKTSMSRSSWIQRTSRSPGHNGSPTWTMDEAVEEIARASVQAVDKIGITAVDENADVSSGVSKSPGVTKIHSMDSSRERPMSPWQMSRSRSPARLRETTLVAVRDIKHALLDDVADRSRGRSASQASCSRKQADGAIRAVNEVVVNELPHGMDASILKAARGFRSSADAAVDAAQDIKKAADQAEAEILVSRLKQSSPTRHRPHSRDEAFEAVEAAEAIDQRMDQAMEASGVTLTSPRHPTSSSSQAKPIEIALVPAKEMKVGMADTMDASGARRTSVAQASGINQPAKKAVDVFMNASRTRTGSSLITHAPRLEQHAAVDESTKESVATAMPVSHVPKPRQHAQQAAGALDGSVGKIVIDIVDAGWERSSSPILKDAALDAFQEVTAAADKTVADVMVASHGQSSPPALMSQSRDGAHHAGVSTPEAINETANQVGLVWFPPLLPLPNGPAKHCDNKSTPPVVLCSEKMQNGQLGVSGQRSPKTVTGAKTTTLLLQQQSSSPECFRGKVETILQLSDEVTLSPLSASHGSGVDVQPTQPVMAPMPKPGGTDPPSITVMQTKPKHCGHCGAVETDGSKFKHCGKCRLVKYCTRQCQKKNWKLHKVHCCKQVQQQLCGA